MNRSWEAGNLFNVVLTLRLGFSVVLEQVGVCTSSRQQQAGFCSAGGGERNAPEQHGLTGCAPSPPALRDQGSARANLKFLVTVSFNYFVLQLTVDGSMEHELGPWSVSLPRVPPAAASPFLFLLPAASSPALHPENQDVEGVWTGREGKPNFGPWPLSRASTWKGKRKLTCPVVILSLAAVWEVPVALLQSSHTRH